MERDSSRVKVSTYRDLHVWQKSYGLCRLVYTATARFPRAEVYGLAAQIRRAAVSIPSNIAEGMGRRSTAEFLRFLRIAYGSHCELGTQLLLARDLEYISAPQHQQLGDDLA
jgi:four helix bundle protein